MKTIEVPPIKKKSGSKEKFPLKLARSIHKALFPQNAEFYQNADKSTVVLLSIVSLNNLAQATDLAQFTTSTVQFYEASLYLN